jgi:DNA-binding XRE family transcriptional regulator
MKPYPWKCVECHGRTINPYVGEYKEMHKYDNITYVVHIKDLEFAKCDTCGAIALEREPCKRISDTFFKMAGILTGRELKDKRELKCLTKFSLANEIGISEDMLESFENGIRYPLPEINRRIKEILWT